MRPHEKLDVWNDSIELAERVYSYTKTFPKEELYCLTSQIRRSAISVGSNIAEGAARQTKTEFKQFLFVARGSLSELETQLIIASRLGYLSNDTLEDIIKFTDRIGGMLTALIKSVKDEA